MTAVIGYPTYEETRAAAAKGNKEAILRLPEIRFVELRNEEHKRTKLQNPDQLPQINGDNLYFTWDLMPVNNEPYIAIKLGDITIWQEIGFFECVPRFNQIKGHLYAIGVYFT